MANYIKSGTTLLSSTVRGNVYVGIQGVSDYGPTEDTGFYNGITPPVGGYTIYVLKEFQGPSIHVASNDSECMYFLKSFGATGTTISDMLSWANLQTNLWVTNSDLTIDDLVVTSNLVLHFDPSNPSSYPGTGTTITDLSGNGLNGTMSNITYTSPYLTFNGTNSSISIADNSLLEPGSGDWTMEVWLYYSTIAGSTRTFMSKCNNGGTASVWSYGFRTASNGNTYGEVGNGTTSTTTPAFTATTGNWYQIIAVWTNVATNSFQLYVNGVSQGSNSHSFASILNSTRNLYFGNYNGGEYSQWFNGRMGIVRLYNKSLTSSEILQNYSANKSKYGL